MSQTSVMTGPAPSARKRTALLVDLDGTLTDPAEGIVGAFRHALAAMGRPAPSEEDLHWIIGPPLRGSFARMLGGPEGAERALELYRDRYGETGLFEAVVYPGIPEALAGLKAAGVALFICTSKPLVYASRILDHFGLARFFDGAYGSTLDGRLEDKAELIAHVLAERRIAPEAAAMLGDRKHDVLGAASNGLPTIGALWGYGGEAELAAAGAAVLCKTPAEALGAFAGLAGV
jgi:phosphoglycolate phosphatase